eukprot:3141805-Pyramimonas_sp.AAC.1
MNADQGNGDQKFLSFCEACSYLDLHWCPLRFQEASMQFTRKPDGDQVFSQASSTIDHIALARGDLSSDCFACWAGVPGDHALVGCDVLALPQRAPRRRPLLWTPSNILEVRKIAQSLFPESAELTRLNDEEQPESCSVKYHDPEDFTLSFDFWENMLGQVYEATQAHPRRLRRIAKEPFWVKSLRTQYNSVLNEASRVAV